MSNEKIVNVKIIEFRRTINEKILQGKNYNVYSWLCKGTIDNVPKDNFLLLSFSKVAPTNIIVGWSGQCKEQFDQNTGGYSYVPIKEKKEWSGKSSYSKPVYSAEEYDALFAHALGEAWSDVTRLSALIDDIKPEVKTDAFLRLFATYMIGAKDADVKITKTPEQVAEKFGGEVITGNEDVPF